MYIFLLCLVTFYNNFHSTFLLFFSYTYIRKLSIYKRTAIAPNTRNICKPIYSVGDSHKNLTVYN